MSCQAAISAAEIGRTSSFSAHHRTASSSNSRSAPGPVTVLVVNELAEEECWSAEFHGGIRLLEFRFSGERPNRSSNVALTKLKLFMLRSS